MWREITNLIIVLLVIISGLMGIILFVMGQDIHAIVVLLIAILLRSLVDTK